MKTSKTLLAFVTVLTILISQFGSVLAAPALQAETISGTVTGITCQTDPLTGVRTFFVTVKATDGISQTVHIDQGTAEDLGLVTVDGDGTVDCDKEALKAALDKEVVIDTASILPNEETTQHPVGAALANFFSDITSYETIMRAHADGFGFGVIAQALWLTRNIDSDLGPEDLFQMILQAKQSGDYSAFGSLFADGSVPQNWGQFRKAVLMAEKGNLGLVMSNKDKPNNGHNNGQGNANGQGNGNGHNNGNSNSNGNENGNGNNGKGNGNGK